MIYKFINLKFGGYKDDNETVYSYNIFLVQIQL